MTPSFRRHAAVLAALAVLVLAPAWAWAGPTSVTFWTDEADNLGKGNANWHTLAVMHMAMHDGLNAVRPTYARWYPAAPDEPGAGGALAEAVAETAAATVLKALHPASRIDVDLVLGARLDAMPAGPGRDRGRMLGAAIGAAIAARRHNDGFEQVRLFPGSTQPGVWRPTPPRFQSSGVTRTHPFLFTDRPAFLLQPPPPAGSPRYLDDVAVTRRLGGAISPERTPAQTDAAIFWAYQSTQRGYVHLAATLVDARATRLSLVEQARIMSVFTAAMADSAIIIWDAKERWSFWRPVDAIRSGQFGVVSDPTWSSFIETPPHPEYPSGHASDCFTGAGLIATLLLQADPVTYTAQSAPSTTTRPAEVWSSDMGEPPAPIKLHSTPRQFPNVQAAATECADARIWAGAHFPSANAESRRVAAIIVSRALNTLLPLSLD